MPLTIEEQEKLYQQMREQGMKHDRAMATLQEINRRMYEQQAQSQALQMPVQMPHPLVR